METRTKAIIASAVVLALLLAGVSGVTYSWFSDTENAGVEVNSGKVSVETSVSSLVDASEDGSTFTAATADEMKNGYYFGFNDEAVATVEDGQVKVENMVANDALTMEVSGTIDYSVSIAYRVSAVVEAVAPATEDDFIVTFYEKEDATYVKKDSGQLLEWSSAQPSKANTQETINLSDFKIELRMAPGSNAQSASATIGMKIEAYQLNAPLPGGSIDVVQSDAGWIYRAFQIDDGFGGQVKSMSVGFTTASAGTYTISAVDGGNFRTISDVEYAELGGLSVTSEATDLATQAATLKVVLDASAVDTTANPLTVKGLSLRHVDGTTYGDPITASKVDKNSDGTYTATYFVTGFSDYRIYGSIDSYLESSDGTRTYGKVADLMVKAGASDTLYLMKDTTVENTTAISVQGTLDGNNHILSVPSSYTGEGLFTQKGDLTIKNLIYNPLSDSKLVSLIDTTSAGGSLVIENVSTKEGSATATNSNTAAAVFITNLDFSSKSVVFRNVTNNTNVQINSVAVSAFGGYSKIGDLSEGRATVAIQFEGCVNNGDLSSSFGAGMYFGSMNDMAFGSQFGLTASQITFADCQNNGAISSSKTIVLTGWAYASGGALDVCKEIAKNANGNTTGTGSVNTKTLSDGWVSSDSVTNVSN